MPMDLVRIITPNEQGGGALAPMPRAEVRIVAPNARVRDYFTQMPIIVHGTPPAPLRQPSPLPRLPGGR
jgi:hypothetical protein